MPEDICNIQGCFPLIYSANRSTIVYDFFWWMGVGCVGVCVCGRGGGGLGGMKKEFFITLQFLNPFQSLSFLSKFGSH